jgi:hypothetical protein
MIPSCFQKDNLVNLMLDALWHSNYQQLYNTLILTAILKAATFSGLKFCGMSFSQHELYSLTYNQML